MTQPRNHKEQAPNVRAMSSEGRVYPKLANDNAHVRLTIRHDRATVVVIGCREFGPRMARLFTGTDSAGATEYAHEIAEVLGTRVQYVVIDRGTERSGWLPVAHHQERTS